MIIKRPNSTFKRWFKRGAVTIIVIDALSCVGSYFIWRKINTERDFRRYLHDNYPFVLEGYYKIGETIDSQSQIRKIDWEHWNKGA
ncbi:unnamed protein product [Phyllotreta striolata]|uniref:Uncharacterized protein n=1 Tax=Phyllotreta striolata TaxID=444603 RepID=A0A9N9TX89_PHYSR|nr:unnamed protein product [Phyllotreta striolata]